MDFVGHALALYQDDSFLDRPAAELTPRVKVRKGGGGRGRKGGRRKQDWRTMHAGCAHELLQIESSTMN